MKKKLLTLAFGLLLAVGWTNVAQAQLLKDEAPSKELSKRLMSPAIKGMSNPVAKQELKTESQAPRVNSGNSSRIFMPLTDIQEKAPNSTQKRAPNRAPNRATITADKTMTRAEYEAITYDWVDANNTTHRDVKITEPATNPYQIAYLLGTTYMNPEIPGLKYSAVTAQDNPYDRTGFGWDIPDNARWQEQENTGGDDTPITYNDITISIPSYWMDFDYIYVQSNGVTVEGGSWSYADNGTSLPSGWGGTAVLSYENNGCCTQSGGGTIIIPHSIIDGKENVTVVMDARRYGSTYTGSYCTVTIAGATPESNEYTTTTYTPKTWSINPTAGGSSSGTYHSDLVIYLPSNAMTLYSITVKNANGTTLTSWSSSTNYTGTYTNSSGTSYTYYTLPDWYYTTYLTRWSSGGYYYGYMAGEGFICIPYSKLDGTSRITVTIQAYSETAGEKLYVNGEGKAMTTSLASYTWSFDGTDSEHKTVTPPRDNGYTVFLVKVKDGTGAAPAYTLSWNGEYNSLINYFDTYIDEVELLTDGLRLNENTDDAGTMFSYSGELNRFYFLGKGADYWWGNNEREWNPHFAPTYDMYEEFSPTTTDVGDEITDFYSKLLYGNSYNVIHDCRGMNYFQHYFSMSGNNGTEHSSMTNLVFWIPDNRGVYNGRDYNEEYLPHVGLYTIWLEAEAERAANYTTSNRMYDVTCEWVSSLNSILDFDVDQDYELWVYVYDEQGNPVADYMVLNRLQMADLLIHNETTFTYQVEQQAESQTIVYRVKGWPKDATNSPGKHQDDPENGTFFALSNLDPVTIPGYNDFLQLGVEHYESDFVINEEHNYYRNFLTIANQEDDNEPLTAQRIDDGEDLFTLYRFDPNAEVPENTEIKAADLLFSVGNNKVEYLIEYANQFYIDDADQSGNTQVLTGYKNNYDALGCPTSGVIANISEGGGSGETPTITKTWDFETDQSSQFTLIDSDGDGNNWYYQQSNSNYTYKTHSGVGIMTSASYQSSTVLYPNNWMISPEVTLGGTLKLWACGQDTNDNAEVFGVYVYQGSYTSGTSGFVQLGADITTTGEMQEYSFDLSAYTGKGRFAIVHHNCSDQFRLNVDDISITNQPDDGSGSSTTTDVTFTAGTNTGTVSGSVSTITVDGVTITNTQTQTSNNSFGYNPYRLYAGTVSFTAPQGSTITKIVFNGNSATNYPISGISGTGYSYSGTVGTWTGDASSVSLTVGSQARCSSIVVTLKTEGSGSSGNFELLNSFLDNSTYTQVGQVVFTLPWKSIQVKLQDESAGTSKGYFLIQNGGKLRFVMPAGYNDANVKFVIHNAPVYDATNNPDGSNYYDGTFTLNSSTGDTKTITIQRGSSIYGDKDYDVTFEHISSGDVITITGTHTVDGIVYNYSPDFKYIHVYVQGGKDGISMGTALNLDAVKFVDQFKAETKEDKHPYQYGYVLRQGNQESGKPRVPVQHTGSTVDGFYSLNDINNDIDREMVDPVNVINAEVNMTLARDPEIFYYTLDRKPSTVTNAPWEAVSKLQRNEDDSYREMFTFLPQYNDQVCNPPAVTTPPTPWIVDRFDNYDIKTGGYNSYMSYVPVIWTHGDLKNRRVKWDTENRHNSYGAPIWKTGVAQVTLKSARAERQDARSTSWTYGGEDCNLYMLDNVLAEAKMPTVNNVKYVPYMFRIFVKSNNGKLRGYQYVPENLDDPVTPGQHYAGAPIDDDELQCVWSGYVNDPRNIPAEGAQYGPNGVNVSYDPATGICTFNKIKVDPTATGGDWDPTSKDNAIFAGLNNIITEENGVKSIDPEDLTIVVRFYYIVEGFDASMPGRGEGDDPAGYGVEGGGDPEAWTALSDVIYNADIESVTYVNALGMTSDKPFDGMNIVITRYSNGMTTTHKVVR